MENVNKRDRFEVEATLDDIVEKHDGCAIILPINGKLIYNDKVVDGTKSQSKERGMSLRIQSWDDRPDVFGIPVQDRHEMVNKLMNKKVRITIDVLDEPAYKGGSLDYSSNLSDYLDNYGIPKELFPANSVSDFIFAAVDMKPEYVMSDFYNTEVIIIPQLRLEGNDSSDLEDVCRCCADPTNWSQVDILKIMGVHLPDSLSEISSSVFSTPENSSTIRGELERKGIRWSDELYASMRHYHESPSHTTTTPESFAEEPNV